MRQFPAIDLARSRLNSLVTRAGKAASVAGAHARAFGAEVEELSHRAGGAARARAQALPGQLTELSEAAKARAQAFPADFAEFSQHHADGFKQGGKAVLGGGLVCVVVGATMVSSSGAPQQQLSAPTAPNPHPAEVAPTPTPKPQPTATPKPPPPAPPRMPGAVGQWIAEANSIQSARGVSGRCLDPSAVYIIVMHESGGDPYAVNRTDINWREGHPSEGLMQTIPSTFYAYATPGYAQSPFNPVDDIMAGENYACARYGSIDNVPGVIAVREGRPYVGY